MKRYNTFGLILILIGAALLLNVLGVFELPNNISIWQIVWPAVLLGLGISSLVSRKRFHFWGALLSLAGIYFLLVNLDAIAPFSPAVIFPAILILIGLAIFLPDGGRYVVTGAGPQGPAQDGGEGFIVSNVVFSADERIITGARFTGAKISAVFGGVNLDLSGFEDCSEPCVITMSVVFGGCQLRLPPGVRVSTDGLVCALGGVEHKGASSADATRTIQINGSITFGGLELYYPPQIRH